MGRIVSIRKHDTFYQNSSKSNAVTINKSNKISELKVFQGRLLKHYIEWFIYTNRGAP